MQNNNGKESMIFGFWEIAGHRARQFSGTGGGHGGDAKGEMRIVGFLVILIATWNLPVTV